MENQIDLHQARIYVSDLARKAGELLKKYFISQTFSKIQKASVDFTTQADIEVDEFLRQNIQKKYPQTQFLTEETATQNYSTFKQVNSLWVIDPLDGTTNFSRGHPNFVISIALVDSGKPKLGIVYAPVSGDLYWAQNDMDHAWRNEQPMKVSSTRELREAVVACDWAWGLEKRKNVVVWLSKLNPHVRQIKSMGSAASDLASLADAKIDVYMHSGLKPWDVAAVALLIQKSGGAITTPTGEKWDIFHPDILTSNGHIHKRILDLLNRSKPLAEIRPVRRKVRGRTFTQKQLRQWISEDRLSENERKTINAILDRLP